MVFSSLLFIFVFLPVTLLLQHFMPNVRLKNIVVLIASVIFYAWGEPKWIVLMLIVTFIDYLAGVLIDKHRGTKKAKTVLISSVVLTLGALVVFKYLNFFTDNIFSLFGSDFKTNIALPIGISFYTFQAMSYVIDVYRDDVKCQKSYPRLLLYVSMFPQLIAGPIVRYSDIDKEIEQRTVTFDKISQGITRFVIGLFKKAVFANFLGETATMFLDGDLTQVTAVQGWIGIIAYFFQIYFDFAGYSDMAIGLGKMMGFSFPENFNYPYISKSITEFWRRWHITLSSFFRDYIYIPLGGNRKRHVFNMLVVWTLTGFWHGASWNFVLWGFYYFLLLVLEKKVYGKYLEKLPVLARRFYSILIVIIGWVFFYYEDMSDVGGLFKAMLGFNGFSQAGDFTIILNRAVLFVAAAVASTPLVTNLVKSFTGKLSRIKNGREIVQIITIVFQLSVMFICVAALVGSTYNPFLYFRF
ncbi:MAG: MBOAT family protein [Clostridia bacterium]|nr:MBOAT family protein [Clostridia bacterium]